MVSPSANIRSLLTQRRLVPRRFSSSCIHSTSMAVLLSWALVNPGRFKASYNALASIMHQHTFTHAARRRRCTGVQAGIKDQGHHRFQHDQLVQGCCSSLSLRGEAAPANSLQFVRPPADQAIYIYIYICGTFSPTGLLGWSSRGSSHPVRMSPSGLQMRYH